MTTVRRVSLAQMMEETGIPALGYARPARDEITIVDGLDKQTEKTVMAHEADHIAKGKEGPFLGGLIGGIGSIIGGNKAAKGARQAAATQERMLNQILEMNQPQVDFRDDAFSLLRGLLGMAPMPTVQGSGFNDDPQQYGNAEFMTQGADPLGGMSITDYILQTPGAQFELEQGQQAVESGAAARGGLLSGAALMALQDRARADSGNLYQRSINNLIGAAGGTVPAVSQLGSSISSAAGNIGSAQMQGAMANASGVMGLTNSLGRVANQGLSAAFPGFFGS